MKEKNMIEYQGKKKRGEKHDFLNVVRYALNESLSFRLLL